MFEIKDVEYKNVLRVKEMEVNEGEIVCIVGESGGGKSTLLRLLNKSLSPTKGTISFRETNLADLDSVSHRRNVVYLNQTPHMFPGTIRDNLLIALRFHEKEDLGDDALMTILRQVRLSKSLDMDVKHLSGGERQRLALGRVLLLDAEVYLMDEPSSSLDDESENLIIEAVVRFAKENNKTLIMVTHSKAQARKHADRIYEIKNGHQAEVD